MLTLHNSKKEEKRKAAGDLQVFFAKLAWMKSKWANIGNTFGDREELRMMGAVFASTASSARLSIVADNIDYFANHYSADADRNNLIYDLKLACLCGSRSIAEFLLKKLNANYTSDGFEFVLSYAAASMNKDWVLDIANVMKGRTISSDLYVICEDLEFISQIRERVGEELGVVAQPLKPDRLAQ